MSVRLILALILLSTVAVAPGHAGDGPPAKVPLDIDVYDQPGGEGKPREGFIKGGSTVNFIEENDHWCHVYGPAVPGERGWIWCGKGDDGQDYSLDFVDDQPEANVPPEAAPVKSDCKVVGPNEEAAGGSSDPKIKYECEDQGGGTKTCCFVKYP